MSMTEDEMRWEETLEENVAELTKALELSLIRHSTGGICHADLVQCYGALAKGHACVDQMAAARVGDKKGGG